MGSLTYQVEPYLVVDPVDPIDNFVCLDHIILNTTFQQGRVADL